MSQGLRVLAVVSSLTLLASYVFYKSSNLAESPTPQVVASQSASASPTPTPRVTPIRITPTPQLIMPGSKSAPMVMPGSKSGIMVSPPTPNAPATP